MSTAWDIPEESYNIGYILVLAVPSSLFSGLLALACKSNFRLEVSLNIDLKSYVMHFT